VNDDTVCRRVFKGTILNGRIAKIENGEKEDWQWSTSYQYDEKGREVRAVFEDAEGQHRVVQTQFDERGRFVSESVWKGKKLVSRNKWTYYRDSTLWTEFEAGRKRLRTSIHLFDGLHRLIAVKDLHYSNDPADSNRDSISYGRDIHGDSLVKVFWFKTSADENDVLRDITDSIFDKTTQQLKQILYREGEKTDTADYLYYDSLDCKVEKRYYNNRLAGYNIDKVVKGKVVPVLRYTQWSKLKFFYDEKMRTTKVIQWYMGDESGDAYSYIFRYF